MSILSDQDILFEIQNGNIIFCDPQNSFENLVKNIGNCSVDVTLGEFYYANETKQKFFNPWNRESIEHFWGKQKQSKLVTTEKAEKYKLKIGTKYIKIQPHQTKTINQERD